VPKHIKLDPQSRTLALLDASGWLADTVERRERYFTSDYLGCWDVLGFNARGQVLVVQCTSKDHVAERVAKCIANLNTKALLQRAVWCEVWGWDPTKPYPRRVHLALDVGLAVVAREGAT
jgi:hypothetical protein